MPVSKRINKDFFKRWTPDMAYVLGFFAADGYITVNKRGGQFWCIQITDKELLYKIREVIEAEHTISERPEKGNERAQYRLQIGSIEMCNDLRRLGLRERKTNSMCLPNIPNSYLSDFTRGYFDGDGNVWAGLFHKERKSPTAMVLIAFTSCSIPFLKGLKVRLCQCGLKGGSMYRSKGNYARLQYGSRDSLKLYDFMYNHRDFQKSGLFLERKKQVFEKYHKLKNAAVV